MSEENRERGVSEGAVVLAAIGANVYWISLVVKLKTLMGGDEAVAAGDQGALHEASTGAASQIRQGARPALQRSLRTTASL